MEKLYAVTVLLSLASCKLSNVDFQADCWVQQYMPYILKAPVCLLVCLDQRPTLKFRVNGFKHFAED